MLLLIILSIIPIALSSDNQSISDTGCNPGAHVVLVLDMSGSQLHEFNKTSFGKDAIDFVESGKDKTLKKKFKKTFKGHVEKFVDEIIDWMSGTNGSYLFLAIVGYGFDIRNLPIDREAGVLLGFHGWGTPEEAKVGYRNGLRKYLLDGYGPMQLGFEEAKKLFDGENTTSEVVLLVTDGDATQTLNGKKLDDKARKESAILAQRFRETNVTVITVYVGKWKERGMEATQKYAYNKNFSYELNEFDETKASAVLSEVFLKICETFAHNDKNFNDAPAKPGVFEDPKSLIPIIVGVIIGVVIIGVLIAAFVTWKAPKGGSIAAPQKDEGFQVSTRSGKSEAGKTITDSNPKSVFKSIPISD